jgi:hypothetical protein
MSHSVSRSDRLTAAWPPAARWLEWLARTLAAAVSRVASERAASDDTMEMYMSREWLEEFEKRFAKHDGDV